MTRWIMLALALIGLTVAFTTKSPGVLGISLVVVLVGLCGFVISLAADRVSANTRPEAAMLQPEVLAAIRERAQAQAKAADQASAAKSPVTRQPAR